MRKTRCQIFLWFILCCLGISLRLSVLAQDAQRPAILGISHVAFRVTNLPKANNFYQNLLGYNPVQVARKDTPAHSKYNLNNRQHIQIFAGLPASQDERMLELAFEVTNAEAMRLYLRGKGIKVPQAITQEPTGSLSFVVTDPENHLVKFIQHPEKKSSKGFRKKQPHIAVSDRILHVGITVADVKKMDAFYLDILGFSEIWRGGRPDNVTNWINMRVPDGTDYIEYMLVTGPVSRQQLGVLHHVALQVPSIQNALDVLRQRANGPEPYKLEAPRVGRNNRWQLNLYDPDGTRVELMEPFPIR